MKEPFDDFLNKCPLMRNRSFSLPTLIRKSYFLGTVCQFMRSPFGTGIWLGCLACTEKFDPTDVGCYRATSRRSGEEFLDFFPVEGVG